MTPHPNRLGLLISLMGLGLGTPVSAAADHEAGRSVPVSTAQDVERVMWVLGLDTAPAQPAESQPPAALRPKRTVDHSARDLERRELLKLLREPVAAPAPAPSDELPEPELELHDDTALVSAEPAAPDTPDTPVDPGLPLALTSRPVDDPDDPGDPLRGMPPLLDAAPPPDVPGKKVADEPVAERVDGLDREAEELHTLMRALAATDKAPVHVDRVMQSLAMVLTADVPEAPAEAEGPPASTGAGISQHHGGPRPEYVLARLHHPLNGEAEGTPAARVMKDLAILVGAPATPTERVLDDLAKVTKPSAKTPPPWGRDAVAMDESRLDGVRGGFMSDTGLKLSFGIERAVYVNGNLVTSTSFNVVGLERVSAGKAPDVTVNNGSLAVVQNGTGNTFLPGAVSSSAVGTVIQNTLDNQKIQNVTIVNAAVNSMQVLRALNLQQAVRNAIVNSIRR